MDAKPYLEHERRYLVDSIERIPGLSRKAGHELIVQGYIAAKDGSALRIRRIIAMQNWPGEFAYHGQSMLELKGPRIGPADTSFRIEHQWLVPEFYAGPLMKLSEWVIRKRRFPYHTIDGGWDVDEFIRENAGLVIAEIESAEPLTGLAMPSWCRMEVTEYREFDNENLAKRPISEWSTSELDRFSLGHLHTN